MRALNLCTVGLIAASSLFAQNVLQEEARSQSAPNRNENPALIQAPTRVREQVMRHTADAKLQDFGREAQSGRTVYRAVLQGQNTDTILRVTERGEPLSMHIAGSGSKIAEAAGAERQSSQKTEQPPGNRSATNGQARPNDVNGTGPTIEEPAGAKRDDISPGARPGEEREIQRLEQTQDPGETQGIPDPIRKRIQEQLGDAAVEEIQPKVFYQLNVRQNGNLQQIWADEKGTLLKPQQ